MLQKKCVRNKSPYMVLQYWWSVAWQGSWNNISCWPTYYRIYRFITTFI